MSNENTIQRLKEQLQMICNKIENVLLEFKEIKEKNSKLKTNQTFFNDLNSKINSINKLKQKITSLQNNLENIYNIGNINKIESEIKKKAIIYNQLIKENSFLYNILVNQQQTIDDYTLKFKANDELSKAKNKLILVKKENHMKREAYRLLDSKIKGQLSKIDVLEKKCKIIKQNIEYQKKKEKKEVEKCINDEYGQEEDLDRLLIDEKFFKMEIDEEERKYKHEINKQNELKRIMVSRINLINEIRNEIKEKLKKNEIKNKINKQKNMSKTKISKSNKKNINYKNNGFKKINFKANESIYESEDSPKSGYNNLNNTYLNTRTISKPFIIKKFNLIKNDSSYLDISSLTNGTFYSSVSNQKDILNHNYKNYKKSKELEEIEQLQNEIKNALKNNVVSFHTEGNEIKKEQNSENTSKRNKPFEKFNFK